MSRLELGSVPRAFNSSRNSLKSLFRRMGRQINQDLQALVASQFFVELAIRLFGFCKVGEALDRFLHAKR